MLNYPDINPVALQIGPVKIFWYGITYLVGFAAAWLLGRYRAYQRGDWTAEQVTDMMFYMVLGVVVGGRLGYFVFYNPWAIFNHPSEILRTWHGGMSFHGGLMGVLVAVLCFMYKSKKSFAEITDFLVPLVPVGLGMGRIGNFLNGELWGRVTDLPWAMVFPHADSAPRHPSQLYEFFLEGVVLFTVVWLFSSRKRPPLAVSGLFLLGYGVFRFLVEFVREPDAELGMLASGWLTMGQILCLPMIIIGGGLLWYSYQQVGRYQKSH
jgi:phosphatidylglycerol---prolipoprotein diacylglyceryl transferase